MDLPQFGGFDGGFNSGFGGDGGGGSFGFGEPETKDKKSRRKHKSKPASTEVASDGLNDRHRDHHHRGHSDHHDDDRRHHHHHHRHHGHHRDDGGGHSHSPHSHHRHRHDGPGSAGQFAPEGRGSYRGSRDRLAEAAEVAEARHRDTAASPVFLARLKEVLGGGISPGGCPELDDGRSSKATAGTCPAPLLPDEGKEALRAVRRNFHADTGMDWSEPYLAPAPLRPASAASARWPLSRQLSDSVPSMGAVRVQSGPAGFYGASAFSSPVRSPVRSGWM